MYKHTQYVPSVILTAVGIAGSLSTKLAPKPVRGLAGLSIAGVLFTFRCLTVKVDDFNITLDFGKWLRVKTISLDEVESCKVKRTHDVIGWGVHFVGDGWLYRVDGNEAVRLKLKNGEKIFIGTDQSLQLEEAINARLTVVQAS